MYAFGSGVLIGTPSGANPTPINVGLVQDVTLNESITVKPLYGQYQRPVALGAGTRKTTGQAKVARISGLALGSLYYGITPAVGSIATQFGEAGTIPTTPFTITTTNSATWSTDLGVVFAATGLPLKRVASAPATGQYSVAAGVYTFAAADTTKTVLISYNYTLAATGTSILVPNTIIGPTISFGLNLYGVDPNTGVQYSLQLYNCVMSKFSFGTKLEDFVMPQFDFECFVNAAGNLGQWNFGEAA
jgi:hypothetical protein